MFAPDRQGFFPALWLQLLEAMGHQEREEFDKLSTKEERITFMYNHRYPKARFELLRAMRQEKDTAASNKKREAGNHAFQSGDYATAMVNYSRAVVLGRDATTDLSLAYANRAACLQRLGYPDFALVDIQLAIENKYPAHNMFKVLERKAECLLTLKRFKESRVVFEEAVAALKLSKIDKNKRDKFLKVTKNNLEKIDTLEEENLVTVTKTTKEKVVEAITKVEDENKVYKAASAKVEVKYMKGRGRFAVAAEDIEVGTTLVVEKPITWALHPDRYGTYCQECMLQVKAVIPCRTCCGVSFCSVQCRDLALSSYHQYECGLNDVLIASALNVHPFLTIRIIARHSLDQLWSLRDKISTPDHTAVLEDGVEYSSHDILNAVNLVCHDDKMEKDDILLRTFVSVFMLKLLQFNNYLGAYQEDQALGEKELLVGKLLLHFTNTFPQNVHDIAILNTPDINKFVSASEIKSLGAGVFLTSAMFNHSCDPSFMRCNFGKGMVSVANRNIQAGEEISECYGQMYYSKTKEVRTGELKRHYKFDCCCLACTENWPTVKELQYATGGRATGPEHLSRIRCSQCGQVLERRKGFSMCSVVTCLVCGQETEVESVPLKLIQEKSALAERLLCTDLDWQKGIKAVKECQHEFDQHLVAPSIELYTTQISIWRSLWMIVGNKKAVRGVMD